MGDNSISQYALGIFNAHEMNENDSMIYLKLIDFRYYNSMIFWFSLVQIIFFIGFNPTAYFVLVVTIYVNYLISEALKEENLNVDLDYSITNGKLSFAFYATIVLIVLNLIDILLTGLLSFNKIKLLFMLNNTNERKFAFFSCSIIFARLLLNVILCIWLKAACTLTSDVNFVNESAISKEEEKRTVPTVPEVNV